MVRARIAVIGPGALGSALARLLERGGATVDRIGRRGPLAGERPAGGCDLALVTVKAFDTEAAVRAALPLVGSAPLVSLQNGLGNVEAIARLAGRSRAIGGTTTHAANRDARGEVAHVAMGETRIGPLERADLEVARSAAAILTRHGLATEVEEDLERALFRKLAVSCGLNTATAIYGLRNGALLEHAEAFELARAAVEEALSVARDTGIALEPPEHARELVRAVAERTSGNRSSMLQDLEAGRRTEVAEINGALVRIARERLSRDAPVNRGLSARVSALAAARETAERHSTSTEATRERTPNHA